MIDLGIFKGAHGFALGSHNTDVAKPAFDNLIVHAAAAAKDGFLHPELFNLVDVVVIDG